MGLGTDVDVLCPAGLADATQALHRDRTRTRIRGHRHRQRSLRRDLFREQVEDVAGVVAVRTQSGPGTDRAEHQVVVPGGREAHLQWHRQLEEAGSAYAGRLDRAADAVLSRRTAVVVAHRLSQAATCDRVVVMEGGRIIETGTHGQLVDAGGVYANLWMAWERAR
ncbi:hypothetical protein ACF07F_15605 [Streptomyces sp. NPDC015237]|uniref:hypothetical protein n=1 Tax=Streptomyces sp. NPDC015237 TaxID=3364949 RepID=UPI0036FB5EF7